MKIRGVKRVDGKSQSLQIDWLMVSRDECSGLDVEQELIATYFRVAHEPWHPTGAYVEPVAVLRGRQRVLFRQHSGIEAAVR